MKTRIKTHGKSFKTPANAYTLDCNGTRHPVRGTIRQYWAPVCSSCNGTGYYDNTDNPVCGACLGTGKA